ncbi:MAG: NAD(P)/FAD-dependent oxidoreductase [Gemmatimonadaceae bacterium]|nr:NAD(P)/FAD-dependent oxidoreductase [Gemmatimonadaceae bacterium]
MRQILILGAGTAGTVMANRLARRYRRGLARGTTTITVVDPDPVHLYQPGLLFLPFGRYTTEHVVRPRSAQLDPAVRYIQDRITRLDPATDTVMLGDGRVLSYDVAVIATGARIAPEELEGLTGPGWRERMHDFYTLEGAQALRDALARFDGGRLVINVVEMPIKCPVAPLEFAFLADAYFTRRGIRDRVTITYATPLDGAFTKATCSRELQYLLDAKGIALETEFNAGRVDGPAGELVSWDERTVPFDLLVSVPTHRGAEFLAAVPDLTNDLGFVHTDPRTLQARRKPNLFAVGDATDVPASKAGSVVHFQAEGLEENIARVLDGRPLEAAFDGHANCFIETGHGKALLIDFNYEVEPLPGHFPFAWGPLPLLRESRLNHLGKLAFRHVYWNALLPGFDLPGVPSRMKREGKAFPSAPPPLPGPGAPLAR